MMLDTDADVFLLSFAQLTYALTIAPQHPDFLSAYKDVLARLTDEFAITKPQLLARTYDTYTVSYMHQEKQELVYYPASEIEEFI